MLDDLVNTSIQLPSGELRLLQPKDAAGIPDIEGVEWAPVAPYWSVLWRSGVALATELEGMDLRGLRVVELGCGLAVPSIAAARAGAVVLATDASAEALELVARNARANDLHIETAMIDWAQPEALVERAPFDLVVTSDVLYERASFARLLSLLPQLAPVAWLADPGRPAAGAFLEEARRRWPIETRTRGVVSVYRMELNGLTSHAAHNREAWDAYAAEYQGKHGDQLAASGGTAWGVWQIPEAELEILGDVADRDVLELGCGAAQWSIALAGLGARVTGLDNSARQLEHARKLMAQAGVDFPLVHGSAESTGFRDASFDVVFCDHGAMSFADPYRTVPEAARVLRPGGLLAFSMHTPIIDIAWALGADHPGDRLVLDYWSLHLREDPGEPLGFQLPYGTWIRLFREHGLVVEDLIELRPSADATSSYRDDVDRDWARRWPMEHIWRVRKGR